MATTLGLLILIAATALIVPIINYLSNGVARKSWTRSGAT